MFRKFSQFIEKAAPQAKEHLQKTSQYLKEEKQQIIQNEGKFRQSQDDLGAKLDKLKKEKIENIISKETILKYNSQLQQKYEQLKSSLNKDKLSENLKSFSEKTKKFSESKISQNNFQTIFGKIRNNDKVRQYTNNDTFQRYNSKLYDKLVFLKQKFNQNDEKMRQEKINMQQNRDQYQQQFQSNNTESFMDNLKNTNYKEFLSRDTLNKYNSKLQNQYQNIRYQLNQSKFIESIDPKKLWNSTKFGTSKIFDETKKKINDGGINKVKNATSAKIDQATESLKNQSSFYWRLAYRLIKRYIKYGVAAFICYVILWNLPNQIFYMIQRKREQEEQQKRFNELQKKLDEIQNHLQQMNKNLDLYQRKDSQ